MQLAIITWKKKEQMTNNIQNNHYLLQCMVIRELLFNDDADIYVISKIAT